MPFIERILILADEQCQSFDKRLRLLAEAWQEYPAEGHDKSAKDEDYNERAPDAVDLSLAVKLRNERVEQIRQHTSQNKRHKNSRECHSSPNCEQHKAGG